MKRINKKGSARREKFTVTVPMAVVERLRAVTRRTAIPQSRIVEAGIVIRLDQIEREGVR
ncbi:MAG: ribbon-helix-helix domain-containing protein [Thermoplasmata archaeon]